MADTDIATVVAFAVYGQASRYAHVATYAASVYDWILWCATIHLFDPAVTMLMLPSLQDDVDLLFTPGGGFAKLSYVTCRYLLLLSYPITLYVQAMDHPLSICLKTYRIPMVMAIPNLGAAVSLLTLRLWAFTGGNWALVVGIALSYLAVSVFHFWVVFARTVLSPLGPAGHGCAPAGIGNNYEIAGFFFGGLLLDTFITASFIAHVVRAVKLRYSSMSIITRTCLRQGVLYFVAISAVNLLNVASCIQPYKPFAGINAPFSLGLPSILACRMFLALRKLGRHDVVSSADISLAHMSFARRSVMRGDSYVDVAPSLALPWSFLGRDKRSHKTTSTDPGILL
ncbi:hypothetical protein AURDEDRAFT_182961 [Auricularia subglabra TFB-10046 SS5]|nr:hypothetical protein AURDEDRAFT_182961 [Auricularia subglabra TFB-10046 SS5]